MAGKAGKADRGGEPGELGGFFAIHRDMWFTVSRQATIPAFGVFAAE